MKPSTQASKGWGSGVSIVPKDIIEALADLGISVQKLTYNEAWSYCPGHVRLLGRENNKPDTWSVNIQTGIHSCFSCGFSGSFVTLVQEVKGYERSAAEQWTRAHGGVPRFNRTVGLSSARIQPDEGLREWNEARLALFTDPPSSARERRGISEGSVNHYGIRWSDGEDPFWVLPIRDPKTGRFCGYQEKSEEGWVSNKPYGVVKSHTLFGIEVFDSPFVLVLESPLDCAVAYTNGIYGAVSTFGAKISDAQFEILFDLDVPIIFGLDNDAAGIAMSKKIKEKYIRSGHRIKFLNYSHIPDKKDIGSGLTTKELQKSVLSAQSMVFYMP
jgi:DNA primase